MNPTITFTTDFGTQDGFVGIMKGVAVGIEPRLQFVDLTHDIRPGDIRAGAWVMSNAYRYFPDGTVHLAVIDPGVGSRRRGVVVTNEKQVIVCPDNGLLTYLLSHRESTWRAFEISNPRLMLPVVSKTFHGRDVFAPVAAHLSGGLNPNQVGPVIDLASLVTFETPPVNLDSKQVCGSVIYIDRFGNLITNITGDLMSGARACRIGSTDIGIGTTYADVESGAAVACVGSHGFVEIAVNGGSAACLMEAEVNTPVALKLR